MFEPISTVDAALMGWVHAYHAPWLDMLMSVLTIAGIMAGVWQLGAVLSLFSARKRAGAWRALLALWLALIVVDLVAKPAVRRVRPVAAMEAPAQLAWAADAEARGLAAASHTYSFPSGHATSAFAGALMLGRVWPHARVAWWTLAVLISYSRTYLGHHYPSDVAAGALLGLAIGYWVLGGIRRVPRVSRMPQLQES